MKLVTEYFDSHEAEQTSNRIRSAGVMTVVTSVRSHNLSSFRTGALKVGLWVVFDDQYDDAIQLLDNPTHQPARKISLVEMEKLQKSARVRFKGFKEKIFEKIGTVLLAVILISLLAYVVIGIINDA